MAPALSSGRETRRRLVLHTAAAAAMLLAGAAAAAESSLPARAEDAAARDILALRERIRSAAAAKDRPALEALYADGFMHLRDSGRIDLKPERVALVLAGEATIEVAPEDSLAVQAYGPDAAVATGITAIEDRARRRPARFRWLALYVRLDGSWRLALSQASRIGRDGR